MFRKPGKIALFAAATALALGLMVDLADAQSRRGSSVGNRGSRSDMSVPSTPTAPRAAQPQTGGAAQQPARPANPAGAAAQVARPSMMSGMMKGLAVGLIGAGIFGLLSGAGFFSGLGSLMGMLGFLLQIALIGGVVWLVVSYFRKRRQQGPAMAGAGAPLARMPQQDAMPGSAAGVAQAPQPQAERQRSDAVGIGPADYEAFQGVLTGIMAAYGREDVAALRQIATVDVAAQFQRDIAGNAAKGFINELGQPQLLQGDLAESWYEDQTAFASVAMRFAMHDVIRERATGRVVDGDTTRPRETTEIWTFRREGMGRPWMLSGIQEA
ncbi:MAG: TIM44-like domain-containing protein [Beijerinckiaceae bacterium]